MEVSGSFIARGTAAALTVINNFYVIRPGSGADAHHAVISLQFCRLNGSDISSSANGGLGKAMVLLEDSFIEDPDAGISIGYPVDDCLIQRNIFFKSAGISVGTSGSVQVRIRNNIFSEQTFFAVENWASYDTSQTIVAGNTFLSTNRLALSVQPGYSSAKMVATNNYWNTTDTNIIDSLPRENPE